MGNRHNQIGKACILHNWIKGRGYPFCYGADYVSIYVASLFCCVIFL